MLASLVPAGRVMLVNALQPSKVVSKLLTLVNYSKFVTLVNAVQLVKASAKLMLA